MSRLRWLALAWVVALGTFFIGAGFAIAGDHIVHAKGVFAMYARMPGGLHTHGVVMSILGLLMLIGLAGPLYGQPEPRPFLMTVVKLTAYYYTWSWMLIMFAPLADNGAFSYLGMIMWLMIAVMPALLTTSPPPERMPREETQLIRAAMEAGLSTEQATAVAGRFFRGGSGGPE